MKLAAAATTVMSFFFPVHANAVPVNHHGFRTDPFGSASECISCHDGSMAHNVALCTTECSAGGSHSIGKPYPPLTGRRRYASLADIRARGIRLVHGKISCISCHNLNNPAKGHLVSEPRRLCTVCHRE